MARIIINSPEGRSFKIDYFGGSSTNAPSIIIIYDYVSNNLKKNLIDTIFRAYKDSGFNIMRININNLNLNLYDNMQDSNKEKNSFAHYVSNVIQDCYTCIDKMYALFPNTSDLWVCGLAVEGLIALQMSMRMTKINRFMIIGNSLVNLDMQSVSSCSAKAVIISNQYDTKKQNNLGEIIKFLRHQKKIYIDSIIIKNTDSYLSCKQKTLYKIITNYINTTFFTNMYKTSTNNQKILG